MQKVQKITFVPQINTDNHFAPVVWLCLSVLSVNRRKLVWLLCMADLVGNSCVSVVLMHSGVMITGPAP